jgi:hypothetical protein
MDASDRSRLYLRDKQLDKKRWPVFHRSVYLSILIAPHRFFIFDMGPKNRDKTDRWDP